MQDWSPDDTRLLINNFVSANESHLYVLDIATAALTPVSEGKDPARRHAGEVHAGWSRRLSRHQPRQRISAAAARGSRQRRGGDTDVAHPLGYRHLRAHRRRPLSRLGGERRRPEPAHRGECRESHRKPAAAARRPDRPHRLRPRRQEARAVDRERAVAARRVRARSRTQCAGALHEERGGSHRSAAVRARGSSCVIPPSTATTARAARFRRSSIARPVPGRARSTSTSTEARKRSSRPSFNPFTQFLVRELGFTVIAPNVRGSTGYGKTYMNLDNGEDREDSVLDIGALLVWIGLQKDLDAKKVFVAGGSYGGYMSLASMVHFGDRLRGGIDVVGISNFVTFLESTSAVPPRPAPPGIRRRAPAAHARLSTEDFAAHQRGAHLQAAAGGAGTQRSARAGQRIAADGGEDPRARRRGLVPRGEGRRPRLPQESRIATSTRRPSSRSSRSSSPRK